MVGMDFLGALHFDNKELIKLIVYLGGYISIINISPSLRRAVREGEEI
jgi:hypothetical protein